MFTNKNKQKKTKKTEDPEEIEGSYFPGSCFTVPMCVVLHLHIEGVLSKGHLLEKGEVVEEEKWGQRLRG